MHGVLKYSAEMKIDLEIKGERHPVQVNVYFRAVVRKRPDREHTWECGDIL